MSKPGGDPSSGISLGGVLRRPKRHPACRRREAQPGSCTERENLIGDAKGKGASGSNREAESTDAPGRGGLLRSSDEAGVMPVERRERAIAIWLGSTGQREEPDVQWKAAAFARWHEPDDARVSSPVLGGARGEIPRAYSAKAPLSPPAVHFRSADIVRQFRRVRRIVPAQPVDASSQHPL